MHLVHWMHVNATGYENASYIGCIKMHMNALCTKCNIKNAYECKHMHHTRMQLT